MTEPRALQWKVSGMDCSGCKLNIERVLSKMEGVRRAEVNFMAAQLEVEFVSQTANATGIENAVRKLGFELEPLKLSRAVVDSASDSPSDSPNDSPNALKFDERSDSPFRSSFALVFQHKNSRQLAFAGSLFLFGFLISHLSDGSNPFLWPLLTLAAGFPVLKKAFFAAQSGLYFSIESLMSLAVIGSLFIGASEEAAMVVLLFLLGEWLEGYAANRARKSVGQLLDLAPQKAWKATSNGLELVSASSLRLGDVVEVKPGSRFPTDGRVTSGESQVDESLITGESTPVFKSVDSQVNAGSLNCEGLLRFSVTSTIANSSLAQVVSLIEKAEGSKAPTERFIEKFSRVYTPCVVALALVVAVFPPLLLAAESFSTWIYRALGVLLIGCPCALVISVPASVSAAIARGARLGVLIKSGSALEKLSMAKSICLDKTGTVTLGQPSVCKVSAGANWDIEEIVTLAASVAQGSDHPLAKSILNHARSAKSLILPLNQATTEPGLGMSGTVEGRSVKVVSLRNATSLITKKTSKIKEDTILQQEELSGRTVSAVLIKGKDEWERVGWISFEDRLKDDAISAISELKKLGFHPLLLTGDGERASAVIQAALGIAGRSQLLPSEKLDAIAALREKSGPVVMVGDGINDAPALAAADVGVAFASGTEVAAERSDVVLMGEKLGRVVELFSLARVTKTIVTQNICFAVGLKAVFLVTTVFGYTGLWIAVLSDTGATVLVTLNALRVLTWRPSS